MPQDEIFHAAIPEILSKKSQQLREELEEGLALLIQEYSRLSLIEEPSEEQSNQLSDILELAEYDEDLAKEIQEADLEIAKELEKRDKESFYANKEHLERILSVTVTSEQD